MAFGNGTDIHDVLPAYDPTRRPDTSGSPEIGQLVYTVVPEVGQTWKVFDAQRADQSSHDSVSGVIRSVDSSKDFRPKQGRLPVYRIDLGECTELLALKSKMRPCVVLAKADGIPDSAIQDKLQRNKGREAFMRPSVLVAPAYSVSTPSEPRAFGPIIAARAECLVYPQFVFLPRSGGIVRNDSVVRLDRAFWTTLPPPTELYALSLSRERIGIMFGQLLTLHGQDPGAEYIEMVALLRECLAQEFC